MQRKSSQWRLYQNTSKYVLFGRYFVLRLGKIQIIVYRKMPLRMRLMLENKTKKQHPSAVKLVYMVHVPQEGHNWY